MATAKRRPFTRLVRRCAKRISGTRLAAKELACAALELGKGRDVKYAAAFALAVSGDCLRIAEPCRGPGKTISGGHSGTIRVSPTLRALFALSQKSPFKAIEHLKTALPYDLAMPGTAFFGKFGGLYPVYLRGQAYLKAGWGLEAAAEFQRVVDHRGIVLADPIGALAHLQLGRALILSREGPGENRLPGVPYPLEGRRPGHPRP